VRSWLRQQLGLQQKSYGSDSGDDSGMDSGADEAADIANAPAAAVAARGTRGQSSMQQGPTQQRQRRSKQHLSRQQAQPSQPLRRSERSNAGRLSAAFASTFGPMGCTQQQGRAGTGNSQQASGSGIPPSTPAATHKPRRTRQGARGPL
jgi:hypothetical protein